MPPYASISEKDDAKKEVPKNKGRISELRSCKSLCSLHRKKMRPESKSLTFFLLSIFQPKKKTIVIQKV